MNRRRLGKEELAARARGKTRRVIVGLARVIGALTLTTAVSAGTYVGWQTLRSGEQFSVKTIAVSGNVRASTSELLALCEHLRGTNILRADLSSASREIERHPWVSRARLARDFPDTIQVIVEEREAVALLSSGGLYAVDAHGIPFKPVTARDRLDLPIVSGLSREELTKEDGTSHPALTAALQVIASYSAHPMSVRLPLSELRVVEETGETSFVAFGGDDAVELRLGVMSPDVQSDMDAILTRLERVWVELSHRNARPRMLDLGNRQRPDWVPARFESPAMALGKESSDRK